MAARSIWKGILKVGATRLPVKLYSAVQDKAVHFHVLEKKTRSRIKQQMVLPDSGEEIPKEEIRKGYEVEKGTFVLLEEEELRQFEPRPSHDIEILEFVSPAAIDPQMYERPYYLGPDGNAADYFALAAALRDKEKEGVVRWVMRKKEYVGALSVYDGHLVVTTLRFAEEVLSPRELALPKGRDITAGEMKMAEQLVNVLRGEFTPEDFKDEYRERVSEFVAAKARGRRPKLHAVRARRATGSLMDQLTRSLKAARKADEKRVA
jgi:DNA end-binding protein Ku